MNQPDQAEPKSPAKQVRMVGISNGWNIDVC